MWVFIGLIVYIVILWQAFVDDPDFQWHKSKFGRIRTRIAQRLRNLFNKSDDKLD